LTDRRGAQAGSDVAQLGWEVYVALVDHRGRWWLPENGAVYP
jgi:hypothetical protein